MTIKCAHCICNRRRWNEILPNSNISHGNCTKLNLNLLLATIHTLGQGKPSTKINNMRTESTTTTVIYRMKNTRKKRTTFNYQLSINYLVKKILLLFVEHEMRTWCIPCQQTKQSTHLTGGHSKNKPKRWKEKVNGKQLALSRLGTQCIL